MLSVRVVKFVLNPSLRPVNAAWKSEFFLVCPRFRSLSSSPTQGVVLGFMFMQKSLQFPVVIRFFICFICVLSIFAFLGKSFSEFLSVTGNYH